MGPHYRLGPRAEGWNYMMHSHGNISMCIIMRTCLGQVSNTHFTSVRLISNICLGQMIQLRLSLLLLQEIYLNLYDKLVELW